MQRYGVTMMDHLNLEGLRYAQAVAETKSFSAAARAYGVTQPALSNGIARLEERLGGKLFDRSPHGVAQTAFGAQILPLIERALIDLDAVAAEARRLTAPGEQQILLGVSPLIGSQLVARAFSVVRGLPAPRDLVLHEANMQELRECLRAGQLDMIIIPAVAPMPRFEHRVIASEPVVVVSPDSREDAPLELHEAGTRRYNLVPDACGLTTFTTQLFQSHDLPPRTYPGEASSYRVLEEWTQLGLGSAIVPRSKLTSPDVPHRPLLDRGREVTISFEAVWRAGSPLGADLTRLADALASAQAPHTACMA